jgi:hypothetical protein
MKRPLFSIHSFFLFFLVSLLPRNILIPEYFPGNLYGFVSYWDQLACFFSFPKLDVFIPDTFGLQVAAPAGSLAFLRFLKASALVLFTFSSYFLVFLG